MRMVHFGLTAFFVILFGSVTHPVKAASTTTTTSSSSHTADSVTAPQPFQITLLFSPGISNIEPNGQKMFAVDPVWLKANNAAVTYLTTRSGSAASPQLPISKISTIRQEMPAPSSPFNANKDSLPSTLSGTSPETEQPSTDSQSPPE